MRFWGVVGRNHIVAAAIVLLKEVATQPSTQFFLGTEANFGPARASVHHTELSGYCPAITPQAIRAPAPPIGWVR